MGNAGQPEAPEWKPKDYVCAAGEDPTNPRTKGAVATIYADGVSVYHLSPKDAQSGAIESGLETLGIIKKADSSGAFRHSQPAESQYRDPLKLINQVDQMYAEFADGKLSGCSVTDMETIKAVDKPPTAAPAAKVSAAPVPVLAPTT